MLSRAECGQDYISYLCPGYYLSAHYDVAANAGGTTFWTVRLSKTCCRALHPVRGCINISHQSMPVRTCRSDGALDHHLLVLPMYQDYLQNTALAYGGWSSMPYSFYFLRVDATREHLLVPDGTRILLPEWRKLEDAVALRAIDPKSWGFESLFGHIMNRSW